MLFRSVRANASASSLAERYEVTIKTFDVIYELLEWLRTEVEHRMPPEIVRTDEGKLKVLKIFKQESRKYVFGGIVSSGVVRVGSSFEVLRNGVVQGKGTIQNLQRNKIDAKEIKENLECGIAADIETSILEGDSISVYTEQIIPKKLTKTSK